MGNFNTADNSTDVNLQWEAKGLGDSVVIIGYPELGLNHDKGAGNFNLVKRKFDVVKNSLIAAAGVRFYGLGPRCTLSRALQLSTDNGAATQASYGSLAVAPTVRYGHQRPGTPQLSDGVVSYSTLAAQIDLCSAAGSTMESINLNLTTKTIWTLVEKLVEAKSRGNYDTSRGSLRVSPYSPMGTAIEKSALQAGVAGYESIYFRGIPFVKDDQCTSGAIFNLNENHLEFISSQIAYCEYISMKQTVTQGALQESGEAITTTAWQQGKESSPTNSLSDVRQIAIYGNVVNRKPNGSGVMPGISTT
jgi:hypothetical protein